MKKIIYIFLSLLISVTGCIELLEENVYSELTPGNFLVTENGKMAVLTSAYGNLQFRGFWYYFMNTYASDEAYGRGGSLEANAVPLSNFTWDSNHVWFRDAWNFPYQAIRDANIVIDNTDGLVDESQFDKLINAEARFIRASAYSFLYNWFGPVPMFINSTPEDLRKGRTTEEEMRNFIESELRFAIEILPVTQGQYGRATKGAALGILTKFLMNTMQWQKALEASDQIIELGKYQLNPNYEEIFKIENKGNPELIWVIPYNSQQAVNNIVALTFPIDFPLPYSNNQVWAATSHLYDDFVDSFDENDVRKNLIVTEYTNLSGQHIQLFGNNRSLPKKYEFDPNAVGPNQGNDFPLIRYSDILLSKAEAINEISGPTPEAIALINQVKSRSNASTLELTGFSQEMLREEILIERKKEFFSEAKRREDLIRQGKYISTGRSNGHNAEEFHVRFPIPIIEISANRNLEQNPGY